MKISLRLLVIACIAAAMGCQQQAAWMQNGGLPVRVPPPETGSYQVPAKY